MIVQVYKVCFFKRKKKRTNPVVGSCGRIAKLRDHPIRDHRDGRLAVAQIPNEAPHFVQLDPNFRGLHPRHEPLHKELVPEFRQENNDGSIFSGLPWDEL